MVLSVWVDIDVNHSIPWSKCCSVDECVLMQEGGESKSTEMKDWEW